MWCGVSSIQVVATSGMGSVAVWANWIKCHVLVMLERVVASLKDLYTKAVFFSKLLLWLFWSRL